jgi:hypothetical protein
VVAVRVVFDKKLRLACSPLVTTCYPSLASSNENCIQQLGWNLVLNDQNIELLQQLRIVMAFTVFSSSFIFSILSCASLRKPGVKLKCCPRLREWNSPCFVVAPGLRILLRFAGFCRANLLIIFVINSQTWTHNLLVPGSNPGGPTTRRQTCRIGPVSLRGGFRTATAFTQYFTAA